MPRRTDGYGVSLDSWSTFTENVTIGTAAATNSSIFELGGYTQKRFSVTNRGPGSLADGQFQSAYGDGTYFETESGVVFDVCPVGSRARWNTGLPESEWRFNGSAAGTPANLVIHVAANRNYYGTFT
jgi:hypothetical protein